MRVLLIEDDPSVSRSIQLILGQQGHPCETAEFGDAGVEMARDGSYDIILLDLSLPDVDGHAVLDQLRSAKVRTPVLILSGSDARDDKLKGLTSGADDYVTKPFDKEELLARMRAIIRRATGRTPSPRAATLDGALLARRGQASPWGFSESYTPVRERGKTVVPVGPAEAAAQPAAPTATPAELKPAEPGPLPAASVDDGRVIVVGNAKGGTGKSTIVMHLIVALLHTGHKVASIDVDAAQGTLTRYVENRRRHARETGRDFPMPEHEIVPQAIGAETTLDERIAKLAGSHAYVVVDTPGYDLPLSRRAHAWADTLITPINDSFVDLDVLANVLSDPGALVQRQRYADVVRQANRTRAIVGRSPIDWLVLRNRLSNLDARNRRKVADALAAMSKQVGFRQGPGLRERVIFRELFQSGLTLLDLPNAGPVASLTMSHVAARQEVRQLLEAIQASARSAAETAAQDARPAALTASGG
jgi:chromosome partitioning protein